MGFCSRFILWDFVHVSYCGILRCGFLSERHLGPFTHLSIGIEGDDAGIELRGMRHLLVVQIYNATKKNGLNAGKGLIATRPATDGRECL